MFAHPSATVLRAVASLTALSALALISGCDSPSGRRAAMREKMEPPQQPLQGSESFFGGSLVVVARLSSPMEYLRRGPRGEGGEGGDSDSDGGSKGGRRGGGMSMGMGMGGGGGGGGGMGMGMGGGGGGGGMGGGGGGGGMGMGGGPGGMGGGPGGDMPGGPGGGGRRGGPGGMGGMPRQFLKITFENKGAEPIALHVADVKSLLGSLAPVPDRMTIAPGARSPLEAMRGSLAANFDAFEVTLRLRTGDREETKTLRLVPTGEPMPQPPGREDAPPPPAP